MNIPTSLLCSGFISAFISAFMPESMNSVQISFFKISTPFWEIPCPTHTSTGVPTRVQAGEEPAMKASALDPNRTWDALVHRSDALFTEPNR